VAEINLQEQMKQLFGLQTVDAEIYRLRSELEEKPKLIEELQKKFEEKKANLKALEDKSKQIQLKRKEKEVELAAKEEAIKKAQTQLYQIKKNEEYQAMVREIAGLNADKSVLEENILKFFDDTDSVGKEIEKEKLVLTEEEKKFNQQKKEVDGRIREVNDRLTVLESNRNQIVPNIENKILAQYERVLKNREGLALVPVKNGACQGCFLNVPPQVINEIKLKKSLVICEACARILFLEEEL
jgi:predicted  nucleic acid-binding Zn-ribbon protein